MIEATITTYTSGRTSPYHRVRLRIASGEKSVVWSGPAAALVRGYGSRHARALESLWSACQAAGVACPSQLDVEVVVQCAMAMGAGNPYLMLNAKERQETGGIVG